MLNDLRFYDYIVYMNLNKVMRTFDNILIKDELDRLRICRIITPHQQGWLYKIDMTSCCNNINISLRGIELANMSLLVLYQYYCTNKRTIDKFVENLIVLDALTLLGDVTSVKFSKTLMLKIILYEKIDRIILTDKLLNKNFLIDQLEKNREFINKLKLTHRIMRYSKKLVRERQMKLIREM